MNVLLLSALIAFALVLFALAFLLLHWDRQRRADSGERVGSQAGSQDGSLQASDRQPSSQQANAQQPSGQQANAQPGQLEQWSARRRRMSARKQWAKQHGGTYRRTVKASGASAANPTITTAATTSVAALSENAQAVAEILWEDQPCVIADYQDVTVVAVARPQASPVTMRVQDASVVSVLPAEAESVVKRIFDQHAQEICASLPPEVSHLEFQDRWVRGFVPINTDPQRWDAIVAALTQVVALAHRLPPQPDDDVMLDPASWDPTREVALHRMSEQHAADPTIIDVAVAADESPDEAPDVAGARPDATAQSRPEPAQVETIGDDGSWRPAPADRSQQLADDELPTRARAQTWQKSEETQWVQPVSGAELVDEQQSSLPALGEDDRHRQAQPQRNRIVRRNDKPAMIFGDSVETQPQPKQHEGNDNK